jgi:thiamine transporter
MKTEQKTTIGTRVLVEAAFMIGLASVLSTVKVYEAPYGGSVTLGSMIPILYLALRHGARVGLLAGTVYGFVQLVLEPYVVHPAQLVLDYPLAFGLLGLAGLVAARPLVGVALGIAGRFVAHWLSGVVFFAAYAPEGMNAYLYSALYNAAYLVPELVLSTVALVLLLPLLRKIPGHESA